MIRCSKATVSRVMLWMHGLCERGARKAKVKKVFGIVCIFMVVSCFRYIVR